MWTLRESLNMLCLQLPADACPLCFAWDRKIKLAVFETLRSLEAKVDRLCAALLRGGGAGAPAE